jgi:hypothetical protein
MLQLDVRACAKTQRQPASDIGQTDASTRGPVFGRFGRWPCAGVLNHDGQGSVRHFRTQSCQRQLKFPHFAN